MKAEFLGDYLFFSYGSHHGHDKIIMTIKDIHTIQYSILDIDIYIEFTFFNRQEIRFTHRFKQEQHNTIQDDIKKLDDII